MTTVFVPAVRLNPAVQARVAFWVEGVYALFQRIAATAQPREPQTPEELLEWAHQYEATQPSYAADLREAALYAQAQAQAKAATKA